MFKKVLVANRGEIAVRIIRACRELGLETVAVFSEADRNALHVRYADEAYLIGPAPSRESYLRADKIFDVAKKSGADAIHPGYGFLSENVGFARRCREEGIIFIGPSPEAMEQLGDKVASKKVARAAGVPVIEDNTTVLSSSAIALQEAKRIGFPVIFKASAGGGGRGMRIIRAEEELEKASGGGKCFW